MIRLRLDISYDGTDFAGWAVQPEQRTVQAVLEDALSTALRSPIGRLVVAGRTDAGVHALGQVAHLDVDDAAYQAVSFKIVRRLAGLLPPDVRVRQVSPVSTDFDARFSALWRHYTYRISDSEFGAGPLSRRDTAGWRRRLDASAMAAAAETLLGLHDFAAFCRHRQGATTIRQLQRLDVIRASDLITIDVQADAFCRSMVRSLVGALASVGQGHHSATWLADLLTSTVRAHEIVVAPARGLTLIGVGYPPADQLAARASEARARRTIAIRSAAGSAGSGAVDSAAVNSAAVGSAPVDSAAVNSGALDSAAVVSTAGMPGPADVAVRPPGRLVDLSVLVETGMPVCDGDPTVAIGPDLTIAEHGVNVARVHIGSQTGTHVDAPNHVLATGLTLAEVPLDRFLGECVVVDLRGLPDREPITAQLLRGVQEQLAPGRILLLCTGWSEHWGTERYLAHPYLAPDATALVLAQGIRTIGIDALSVDPSPADLSLPSHHLIAAVDGVIIENLRCLEELIGVPAEQLELMALPVRLDAVDGAPIRAVARIR